MFCYWKGLIETFTSFLTVKNKIKYHPVAIKNIGRSTTNPKLSASIELMDTWLLICLALSIKNLLKEPEILCYQSKWEPAMLNDLADQPTLVQGKVIYTHGRVMVVSL